MRTCLIVDVHNLYLGAERRFPGSVVNYGELLKSLSEDDMILNKIAYGRQPEEKVRAFATMLRRHGFELSFGNTPHNIEMALKVAEMMERNAFDHLILASNYFEAGRILKFAKEHGKKTTAIGFELPLVFENYAECIEIDDTLVQERPTGELPPESLVQSPTLAIAA